MRTLTLGLDKLGKLRMIGLLCEKLLRLEAVAISVEDFIYNKLHFIFIVKNTILLYLNFAKEHKTYFNLSSDFYITSSSHIIKKHHCPFGI